MNLRYLHAPLLLAIWQLAPYSVAQDSSGRLSISVGYGAGEYESQTFSCSGERLSSTPVDFQAVGVQVDAWPSDRVRLTGFAGSMSTLEYDGPYGGIQLAAEWETVGLGLGVTSVSGLDGFTAPSFYMRFGRRGSGHLQLDMLSPSPTFGTTGWMRAGIGFNRGYRQRVNGLFGVALMPYSYLDDPTPRLFGELDIPVRKRLELSLRGSFRKGVEIPQWAAGAALRFHIGG
ncbi:MAG: hypothetical protein V3U13_08775 [Gemmatimonadota bacterium]